MSFAVLIRGQTCGTGCAAGCRCYCNQWDEGCEHPLCGVNAMAEICGDRWTVTVALFHFQSLMGRGSSATLHSVQRSSSDPQTPSEIHSVTMQSLFSVCELQMLARFYLSAETCTAAPSCGQTGNCRTQWLTINYWSTWQGSAWLSAGLRWFTENQSLFIQMFWSQQKDWNCNSGQSVIYTAIHWSIS